MKERNRGEWSREKDHLCPCFRTPEEGPFQYEMGETYFCFSKMKVPFTRSHVERYELLLNRFSADPAQEWAFLSAVHATEVALGRFFDNAQLRAALMMPKQDVSPEAWIMIADWIDRHMIDAVDHRMTGIFKTKEDWTKHERALLAKYAKHTWAHVRGLPPVRWHQLQAFTNRMEMVHRTDGLFLHTRPRFTARRRRGAADQVESMGQQRRDIDG